MTATQQTKQGIILLLVFILLLQTTNATLTTETEKNTESTIHEEIVNDQTINFMLGTREALEAEQATEEENAKETESTKKITELTGKVIGDNTVVRISGYDVTDLSKEAESTETENEEIDKTTTQKAEEPTTFFGKIVRFLFG